MAERHFTFYRGEHVVWSLTLPGSGSIAGQSFALIAVTRPGAAAVFTRTTAAGDGVTITDPVNRVIQVVLPYAITASSGLPAGDYKFDVWRTDGGSEDRADGGSFTVLRSTFAAVGPPLATPGTFPITVPMGGTGRTSLTADRLLAGAGTAAVVEVAVGSGLTLTAGVLAVGAHDASLLTTGTLADARLSANVARRDQANTFRGTQTVRNAADTRTVYAVSEAVIAAGYDAGHVALVPGVGGREYRIGTYDAAGEWLFARSDVTGMMSVYLGNTGVSFGARGTDTLSLKLDGGTIVLCPGAAGGDRKVQIGRRVTDDSAAVGASTELWTRTGQALPALAVKAPGGASDLMKIDPNGAVTPASLADASAPNGSLYYSTTAGRLVYKDAAGVVNVLY